MGKVIRFIPLILFIALGIVLYRGLFLEPQKLPSALVGKTMPAFSLPDLIDSSKTITNTDMGSGIKIINVWATWCPACRHEHPYLLEMAKSDRYTLIGINYKDERPLANQWLVKLGDPFALSIFDADGTLGLDLGVYGAPETFVIDHHNIVRKRFAGTLDGRVWEKEFEGLIKQIEQERARGE